MLRRTAGSIPAGRCVVLCGDSGCGKSTLLRCINGLIPQFYEGVLKGFCRLNGQDTAGMRIGEIGELAASVFQNPRSQFFTVNSSNEVAFGLENLGLPQETIRQRVEEAFRVFHLERLKDRNVYELSSGERQRISIARAIMKDAPVIILDEATANVDPENEKELMEAVAELTHDKTVIMIAHRLKTVRHADQIIVVDHGEIVQQGTHDELVAVDGLYRRFVVEQQQAAGWKV